MYYPDDLIEEVRSRNDVVDVIGNYVKLTRKGNSYFGLCPFHNEKTGSFSVSRQKQMYYCFGCGAGGNVITFLMNYNSMTFSEALKALADRAGIALPEKETSPEEKKEASLKARILEVNREAGTYFYHQLRSPAGERGLAYLKGRQLTDETIRHFGLGYSVPYANHLYRFLKEKGYEDEVLKASGLFRMDEKGVMDKFWNRVMYPIMDVGNKIIGFGGRVMGDGEPKYLNSPETKVFDKSRNLYGLNYARLTKKNYMICCEGYMDVIAMHQAGFTNAVASLGTALTERQAVLLKRYTSQVILAYDSDGAGVNAALRAIPIMRGAGMSVKVLNMRPHKDPDEFMKSLGPEEFENRLKAAENFFLFQVRALEKKSDMADPESRSAFYREICRMLTEFPEELERNTYLEAVCDSFHIPEESLKKMLGSVSREKGLSSRPLEIYSEEKPLREERKKQTPEKDTGLKKAQRMLLTGLISDKRYYPALKGQIGPEDFTEELYRRTAEYVFEGLEAGNLAPAGILDHFINDDDQYSQVAQLFHAELSGSLTPEEEEKAFSDMVRLVKKSSLDEKIKKAASFEEMTELMKQLKNLETQRFSFHKQSGT